MGIFGLMVLFVVFPSVVRLQRERAHNFRFLLQVPVTVVKRLSRATQRGYDAMRSQMSDDNDGAGNDDNDGDMDGGDSDEGVGDEKVRRCSCHCVVVPVD